MRATVACFYSILYSPPLSSATWLRAIASVTFPKQSRRPISTMTRSYDSALAQLAALQSNLAITSLFTPPTLAVSSSSSPAQGTSKARDLNSLAIPEMVAWLERAGMSQGDLAKLRCIHVAGTKGKGSVCAYLTSILTQELFRPLAGRVGTYTSPHLVTVRERIMLDGQPISQELFARYFFEVWEALTASARAEYLRQNEDISPDDKLGDEVEAELRGPATKPFYFRFLTILAFHAFLKEGVKSAVIECGIGGEYDSTNILTPEAVTGGVVTQLGIDHVGMLGGTLPEIAWHKIGIAKSGRKCFTRKLEGESGEAAMTVMRERAAQNNAFLVEISDDGVATRCGVQEDIQGGLEGQFQKYNQTLALQAASEHLGMLSKEQSLDALDERSRIQALGNGIKQAMLRGRCETKNDGNTTWLIDGAHTADSLQEVAKWFSGKLEAHTGARKVLIFNQQERDVGKLLEVLCQGLKTQSSSDVNPFDKIIFTRNDLHARRSNEVERDLSVQKAAADALGVLYTNSQSSITDNVADAINEVQRSKAAGEPVWVLVTGSLHLAGAILQTLEPDAPR